MLRFSARRLVLPAALFICLALLSGCAPLGLRLPWGLNRMPWTIACLDANNRVTIPGDPKFQFDKALAPEGAVASPTGAHLAVVTRDRQLWVVPVIAGDPVQMDAGPVQCSFWPEASPWTPDGRALVYISGGNIYYKPLTKPARRLTTTGDAFTATISADSKFVAFGRKDSKEQDLGLWKVAVAGGEPMQLVQTSGDVFSACSPHWSPDGQWVAFLQAYEGGALGVAKADGTDTRIGIEGAWEPLTWLQDSDTIVFLKVQYGESASGVDTYTVSTGKSAPLAAVGQDCAVGVAPDRQQALLAVIRSAGTNQSEQSTLSLISLPDGHQQQKTTTISGAVRQCLWAPDGTLAALTLHDGDGQVWLGKTDLSNFTSLGHAIHLAGWVRKR